jgi:hypothetical protein
LRADTRLRCCPIKYGLIQRGPNQSQTKESKDSLKDSKQSRTGRKSWGLFGWSAALLILMGGFWLYTQLSEVGLMGMLGIVPQGASQGEQSAVRLARQPVYQIKKKQSMLGVNVLRIVSKQQPEEFLVVEGVPRPMVDRIYGKPPDLGWAKLMANQLLKLRQSGEDSSPISVDVQTVRTIKSGVIQQKRQKLPYWQLEVKFQLSNENAPRAYEAAVVRNFRPEEKRDSAKETLLVGYAQKEAFQQELVVDLMNNLRFEQN